MIEASSNTSPQFNLENLGDQSSLSGLGFQFGAEVAARLRDLFPLLEADKLFKLLKGGTCLLAWISFYLAHPYPSAFKSSRLAYLRIPCRHSF